MEESISPSKISRVKKGLVKTPYYHPDKKQKKKSGRAKKILPSVANKAPTFDSIDVSAFVEHYILRRY